MKDYVNPDHYKTESGKQVWELMIEKFGVDAFLNFCDLNVFKYKHRAGKKQTEDADYDESKAFWYARKAQEIRLAGVLDSAEKSGFVSAWDTLHIIESKLEQGDASEDIMHYIEHRDIVYRQYGEEGLGY